MDNIKNFSEIVGYHAYLKGYYQLLETSLSSFFSANVSIDPSPLSRLFNVYGIDVESNPRRLVYLPDGKKGDIAIMVVTVKDGHTSYIMGIKFIIKPIGKITKTLDCTCHAITDILNTGPKTYYTEAYHLLDETLIVDIISKLLSVGYNPFRLKYLIRYFIRLRATTFEGKYFSSGLIVTTRLSSYREQLSHIGKTISLDEKKRFSIFEPIKNRQWYLADGVYTFYVLTGDWGYVSDMFIPTYDDSDFLAQTMLKNTLKGHDFMMRVENGRDLSIFTSRGIEIVNQENIWHYRDYSILKSIITEKIPLDDKVFSSILYFVRFCSKNDVSSIIWLVANDEIVDKPLKFINRTDKHSIMVTDRSSTGLIKRFLSSDGATVIKSDGLVLGYGGIVDNQKIVITETKGTGEAAAQLLAKDGVAIKVSQDGSIKVYYNDHDKAFVF